MFNGLLPIGSVVLLKNSTKRVMIIGFCQKEINDNEEAKIWDYAGCLYPEGYLGPNQTFLFNGDQIERIFAIGYQDEEQFEFKKKADSVIEQLRKKSAGQQEEQPQ
ncbi:MAG: DUF4176 domain-containing protein [Clostridiaceae bacterium]|jgi:hypothetical protein|nr:DUF4176 domain-containing protein [Clostridiaceae bacterium]